MTSYKKIKEDIVVRIKNKDKFELGVLRLVASKIEKGGDYTDAGVLVAIKSELKEMKQTLEALEKISPTEGAQANVEAQKARIAFLESYLPAQMTETQISDVVDKILAHYIDKEPKIGPVMKDFKAAVQDTGIDVDMGLVSRIIKEKLTK